MGRTAVATPPLAKFDELQYDRPLLPKQDLITAAKRDMIMRCYTS